MPNKLNSFRKVFFFLLLATSSNIVLAQRTITGLVTDADNKEPLMITKVLAWVQVVLSQIFMAIR